MTTLLPPKPLAEAPQAATAVLPAYSDSPRMHSGCGFGIEIEFDGFQGFQPDHLGALLFDKEYLKSPLLMGYHARYIDNLYRHKRGWRYEEEHSISGAEIISPYMVNTPETWDTLADICQTVESFGCRADSDDIGFHVHIDAAPLGSNLNSWNRLVGILSRFEDHLFRMASNPSKHRHRNNKTLHPIPFTDLYQAISAQAKNASSGEAHNLIKLLSTKNYYINTYNVAFSPYSRVSGSLEFKFWDGTLSPSLIQAYIRVCEAIVFAACDERTSAKLELRPARPKGFYRKSRKTESSKEVQFLQELSVLASILFPEDTVEGQSLLSALALPNEFPKSWRRMLNG